MPYKNPDRQRAAQAEHARRKRAAGVEPSRRTLGPLISGEVRLATAKDVLAVIEAQIERCSPTPSSARRSGPARPRRFAGSL